MVALRTPPPEIGQQAHFFKLIGIDGNYYSLNDVKGPKGLILFFICNHCPYVKAIISRLVEDIKKLQAIGVGAVAISSNDASQYPEDSSENMKMFSNQNGFTFPYLYDESQEVAKKYNAICTPDFYGYNANLELQYRGRFDSSERNPEVKETKHELLIAMQEVANTGKFSGEQISSIGCSIKWR